MCIFVKFFISASISENSAFSKTLQFSLFTLENITNYFNQREKRSFMNYTKFCNFAKFCQCNGPILLQTIPIPVQVKKNWAWTGIIFDSMILLRIVFRDHLKGWNSQQAIILYEVSWLNFDNVRLYNVHTLCALLSLKKKQKYRINTLWAWTRPGSKSQRSYSES